VKQVLKTLTVIYNYSYIVYFFTMRELSVQKYGRFSRYVNMGFSGSGMLLTICEHGFLGSFHDM